MFWRILIYVIIFVDCLCHVIKQVSGKIKTVEITPEMNRSYNLKRHVHELIRKVRLSIRDG